MTERAELMRIYRSNGISSISLMRNHYNKYDDGGDIQPSDATFRATLTNPVNSYRSNAPAGIGDAAITKATGLLNPITAATLTAAPPYKINPENISSSVDDYRYHAPEYIDNNTSLKEDTKRERLSKFIQAYNINHNNWKEPYTDSLINISKDKNIEPEDLAKVIASESSFDYTQKNSESTAYGLIQETQPNLSQRYKDDPEYKEKVMAEYLNKNRRVEDQFHDIRIELDEIKRLTKGRKLTAGDIKYNLLAPHSNRANLISETSWKNLTKKQKDSLTFGKSTYQDYIDLFNRQMERAFKEKTE